jgi:hypothetical protein
MKTKTLVDITQEDDGTITDKTSTYPWTVADEAIHRGANYAEHNLETVSLLRKEQGMTMFAILKNAYQEGFMHGFTHRFDDHSYERQTDTVSDCPTEEKKDGNTL